MKKLLTLFLLLLALSLAASAQVMPHPIYGHLTSDGYAVSGADITVNNLNTKTTTITKTDDSGVFQIDLGNVDINYRNGDTVKVSINYCNNLAICTKTVIVSGGGNEISWDIKEIDGSTQTPPPLPDTVTIINVQCWNGQLVGDVSLCPPIEPQTKLCEDGSEVAIESECPEKTTYAWLWGIIGTLAAIFLGAGGWKFYNGKFKHYHNGIVGYHDPSTEHTNLKYRHTIWKKNPFKCIMDVKKIQQGISLE